MRLAESVFRTSLHPEALFVHGSSRAGRSGFSRSLWFESRGIARASVRCRQDRSTTRPRTASPSTTLRQAQGDRKRKTSSKPAVGRTFEVIVSIRRSQEHGDGSPGAFPLLEHHSSTVRTRAESTRLPLNGGAAGS